MAGVVAVAALFLGGCASGAASAPVVPASATPSTPADNGVAALEPAAIFDRAKAALTEAKTFRLKGFVTADGTVTGMDLEVRGSDVRGILTRNKTKVEMLTVGKNAYIRPDYAFWKASLGDASLAKASVAKVKGRWIQVSPTDKNFAGMLGVADVNKLLDGSGGWIKQYVTKVGANRALMVSQVDSRHSTLYVAVDGPAYPLRLQGPTEAAGSLTFSDFGAAFADLKAPPASTVINFNELLG
ncbi:hypothetical protein BJ973_001193 [Actinoplanes tereljensis]|uniref:hypothetical protein n=1 Tax=Paractinoplanes tereljensis TaxID=571912 RepID=UPI001943F498|nr:hypothetical protein [Actinoplanes tereljensis]